ncbi:MAG TPA: Gfo/Idh/MocA family oxidoreductase [Gemmataceae bacterium]|nr:Gfo/Idh/MocA family oxidoreductase [Gemmataceae bacterium]
MPTLADLERPVGAALAAGRIGQPVFVRYLLHANKPIPDFSPDFQSIASVLQNSLAQPVVCGHSLICATTGQASFLLKSTQARLGLVSIATSPAATAAADLTVLGTRGAIYHPVELLASVEERFIDEGPMASEPTKRPYGVLLVWGSHTHQEDYAQAFAADPRCRIVGVTDEVDVDPRRRELNERLAQVLGVPYLLDLEDGLRRNDVDIVSICAPPERRGRIAIRCAEAGKHLYLDKSLAPRLDEARGIVAAVQKAGVRSQMFSFVSAPWARRAKRVVESGALGKLLAIHADTFFAKGRSGTVGQPRIRQEEYPPQRHQLVEAKRELDNVGVYPITLVHWLTGQKFASVRASTANFFFAEHAKHDVEDFGAIVATLDDGTHVTIAAGRTGWSSHPAGGVNRLVLVGSDRSVTIDAHRPRLEVYADEPSWTPPPAHPEDPMAFWTSTQRESGVRPKQTWIPLEGPANDVACFLDRLDAQRETEMPASAAAHATEVLLAAYKSAATGSLVPLPLGE